jgi:colanic acid biosynthesis glycosyl transferase WcaI
MSERILFLTQWFDPEPTFKGMAFASELVRQGYEVDVITGFPNYPGGKLYPGYKLRWLQKEMIDGVRVTRVPLYPSHDGSAIKRIFNYLSFALSALLYGLFGARKADVIYAYHPPLTIGIIAVLLRFFRRTPVVYDVQDMWPDTLRATGMLNNSLAIGLIEKICSFVYRHVDRIVVLSPGFKRLLIERRVPDTKIEIIYNWCDEASLDMGSLDVNPPVFSDSSFNILFAGTMGKAQALDSVIEAAQILQMQQSRAKFVFLGGGIEVDRLRELSADKCLDNVEFLPRVPMDQVGSILNQADVLLVHLRDDPLFEITIPSKIQAYLHIGKPVLIAVPGDAAALIKDANCGVLAQSQNAVSIAEAANYLSTLSSGELILMGQRGKDFYRSKMSLQVGVGGFAKIFDSLIFRGKSPNRLLTAHR